MDNKDRNCASCTKRGRKCGNRFHSDREWTEFEKAETKTKEQLDEALAEQVKLSARIVRLFKEQEFLRSRGKRMLDHDTLVMDRLDEEDPPSSQESSPLELSPGFLASLEAPINIP
jgi:hypothetical protein